MSDLIGLTHNVPPLKTLMGSLAQVYYNVLINLRKLQTKLTIYYDIILPKEMRDSRVKALVDLEICLVEFDYPIQVDKVIPITIKETLRITFNDTDLLLGTITHNMPLYISIDFDR